jgi:hypothetical protein
VAARHSDAIQTPKNQGVNGRRTVLCHDSQDENILIELKIRDRLTYVGD